MAKTFKAVLVPGPTHQKIMDIEKVLNESLEVGISYSRVTKDNPWTIADGWQIWALGFTNPVAFVTENEIQVKSLGILTKMMAVGNTLAEALKHDVKVSTE